MLDTLSILNGVSTVGYSHRGGGRAAIPIVIERPRGEVPEHRDAPNVGTIWRDTREELHAFRRNLKRLQPEGRLTGAQLDVVRPSLPGAHLHEARKNHDAAPTRVGHGENSH